MKKIRIITGIIVMLMAFINFGCTSNNQSKTYYVSPEGNDNNAGLSENAAWKSIERVNLATFQPGSAILFESDGVWKGQLRPQGNGESGKPITIGSYGKGSKPVINIGDLPGAGIKLVNQSWWEIRGIEITSGAQPKLGVKREGISVTTEEGGKTQGIVIRDCYIHDIWGQVGGTATSRMINIGAARRSFDSVNDIRVENNVIKRCDKVGINVSGRNNIIIRGNYMEDLGGDGIILSGATQGLIEYNVADRTCLRSGDRDLDTGGETWWPHTAAIWLAGCNGTMMQFNEVYNTERQPANHDGQAYDFDYDCKGCILQYNYSRNNHGLLLIMTRTYRNIARYNISENDQTHLIKLFCDTAEQNLIHNNVFYVDYGTADIDFYYGDKNSGKKDIGRLGASFRNNIFYATGQGRFRTIYSHRDFLNDDSLANALKGETFYKYRRNAEYVVYEDFHKPPMPVNQAGFYNNCYFGPWANGLPYDPKALLADPLFVAPGTGGIGFSKLNGYKLLDGSPCINAGVFVEIGNKRDFYGNPVTGAAIDIGVYEKQAKQN